ncbi:MAG TPA: hypothetical protein VNL39_06475 [Xanthobacteraceae bacterium]|nr:hypothetical protein [Xanthobacteraceae bacterium]
MHIVLYFLGLVTAAAGFLAIGFGIPVHAFSFGNTLIIAGATAVVGGFLMFGLAAVVRQLKRIADANLMHGASFATNAAADPFAAQASFLGTAKPDPMSVVAPAEPRVAAATTAEPDTAIAWLRPKDADATPGERAVIEEMEASLAPQPSTTAQGPELPPPLQMQSPQRLSASPAGIGKMSPEPTGWSPEPKGWMPMGTAVTAVPHQAKGTDTSRPVRSAGGGSVETASPGTARSAERIERVRRPESAVKPGAEERAQSDSQTASSKPSEGPRPVAILKSGMIDGMAYTLYADGSIEAVLPTGPIRFASVEALRAHLEKSG